MLLFFFLTCALLYATYSTAHTSAEISLAWAFSLLFPSDFSDFRRELSRELISFALQVPRNFLGRRDHRVGQQRRAAVRENDKGRFPFLLLNLKVSILTAKF